MTERKHTPGPWKAQPREFSEGQWFLEGQWEVVSTCKTERLIAEAAPHIDSDSEEANARLIAAAPELLKELEDIYHRVVNLLTDAQLDTPFSDGLTARKRLAEVRSVLAKATGG